MEGTLADDSVSSAKIHAADGTTGQTLTYGYGVKTGHIQDGAITTSKFGVGIGPVVTGTILMWGATGAPSGYVLCDGGEYNRTNALYSNLFSVISTNFGSSGGNMFNVPDLKSRFPYGYGSGDHGVLGGGGIGYTGTSGSTGTRGRENVTLTIDQIPSHQHSQQGFNGGLQGGNNGEYAASWGSTGTGFTGGSQSHNNMPPYIVLNYIIKL